MGTKATAALTEVDTFSDPIYVRGDSRSQGGLLDVSITGNIVGTVTVQRSRAESNFLDLESFVMDGSTPIHRTGQVSGNWYFRVYMTAYTSGTANIDISV